MKLIKPAKRRIDVLKESIGVLNKTIPFWKKQVELSGKPNWKSSGGLENINNETDNIKYKRWLKEDIELLEENKKELAPLAEVEDTPIDLEFLKEISE